MDANSPLILLDPDDNVAVARVALVAGQRVTVGGCEIQVCNAVAPGHKVALAAMPQGDVVRRYGEPIGRASAAIAAGEHVHTHNLRCEEAAPGYEYPEAELPLPAPPANMPVFLGYPREDGRAGTRNYIAVVAASNCAAHAAELAARSFEGETLPPGVDGVVAFTHETGCGQAIGPDTELLERTLNGVIHHPNVAASVVMALGCEVNRIDAYLGRPGVAGVTLQGEGGTLAAVEAARREICREIDRAAAQKRVEVPVSKLVLGLNCGGSDSFSGITANPALGRASDLLVAAGGTAVLAETPEIVGAEHLLVRRARNRRVAEKLLDAIERYRRYLEMFGESFDDNPSPGNKAGGLTNIVEKSLGAVAKAGTSTLIEVLDYAERITGPGFVFMNTPGYDPVSLAGLAAGGVNVIAFTTGRGSAIGFPTVPVLKIASRTEMFRRMRDNMDVNAGRIADGDADLEAIGGEILDAVIRVASGERTAAERLGHREFAPWRIGPVM